MPADSAEEATEIPESGYALLNDPLLNKGMAFTEAERDAFDLHGLLPPHIYSLDEQVARRLVAYHAQASDLDRYVFLRSLQDTNEILFHAVLARELEAMMPVVYTPTVGKGCEVFSHIFRKPRGLYLSLPQQHRIPQILAHPRFDHVAAIVVTDGERILGLGDQGAGGMGIPIGKLALYTACAGLHPKTTLPIFLDVGTDNPERLADPLYIGWHHARVRGQDYDDFVEAFVTAVAARWPHVLLQWEDFAIGNANRLLARYRDRLCTFNDDIQGTAAVAVGAVLAAVGVTGVPLAEQRFAVLGAGSAGCGIAALLLRAMEEAGTDTAAARRQFFLVDRQGLLTDDMPELQSFQRPFAQPRAAVQGWAREGQNQIGLAEVVENGRPTVLIGTSGQPGAFPEHVVRAMARHVARPVIFPLSNPTARAEAQPADLVAWTEGRAVVGAGSPFPPVLARGRTRRVDQPNNAYVFPGIGLGAIAAEARGISDGMFMAAARALAEASPSRLDPEDNLLPPLGEIRAVSHKVAAAVARQAMRDGLAAPLDDAALDAAIRRTMWTPVYRPYRHAVGAAERE